MWTIGRFQRALNLSSEKQMYPQHDTELTRPGPAATKVFQDPYLFELILLELPVIPLATTYRRVCKHWQNIIDTTPAIKWITWHPDTRDQEMPISLRKIYKQQPVEWNPLTTHLMSQMVKFYLNIPYDQIKDDVLDPSPGDYGHSARYFKKLIPEKFQRLPPRFNRDIIRPLPHHASMVTQRTFWAEPYAKSGRTGSTYSVSARGSDKPQRSPLSPYPDKKFYQTHPDAELSIMLSIFGWISSSYPVHYKMTALQGGKPTGPWYEDDQANLESRKEEMMEELGVEDIPPPPFRVGIKFGQEKERHGEVTTEVDLKWDRITQELRLWLDETPLRVEVLEAKVKVRTPKEREERIERRRRLLER